MALHIPPNSSDALLTLTRQEHHLKTQLQTLLDAQSAGLLFGLGHADVDSAVSVGTNTPTSSSTRSPPPFRPTQSPSIRSSSSKPIGLRGARRGISRTIADLASLKSQHGELLGAELEERGQDLDVVEKLTRKQTGLQKAIVHIEAEPASTRITNLRAEEHTLSREITDLETKLYTMKARRNHLLREIEGLDNSVQAKLSSYRESLALAEKEARQFLSRPPVNITTSEERDDETVWSLPVERRTLELAKEYIMGRRGKLRKRWREAEKERVALLEGRSVWKEVIAAVTSVEKQLQDEMSRGRKGKEVGYEQGMNRILAMIEKVKDEVERNLRIAEAKDWRLLICAIGAELEALLEGEGVLRGALEAGVNSTPKAKVDTSEGQQTGIEEFNGLDESRHSENGVRLHDPTHHVNTHRLEEEDVQPGPDLLISHQDDDEGFGE